MNIDNDKIDEATLALLYLTLHDNVRAWKQIDFDVDTLADLLLDLAMQSD